MNSPRELSGTGRWLSLGILLYVYAIDELPPGCHSPLFVLYILALLFYFILFKKRELYCIDILCRSLVDIAALARSL